MVRGVGGCASERNRPDYQKAKIFAGGAIGDRAETIETVKEGVGGLGDGTHDNV